MAWAFLLLLVVAVWNLASIAGALRNAYQLQLAQLKATRDATEAVRAHLAWCQAHFETEEDLRERLEDEAADRRLDAEIEGELEAEDGEDDWGDALQDEDDEDEPVDRRSLA